MKVAVLIFVVALGVSACQTVPPASQSAVHLGNIQVANYLACQGIEISLRSSASGGAGFWNNLASQAAAVHDFRLVYPGEADASRSIAIHLQEREYSLDLEQWNSVVATLSLDNPPLRVMLTDDTHLSLKSAGYAFDRLDQLFKRLRVELDRYEGRR